MRRQTPTETKPRPAAATRAESVLTDQQLDRWAELIAAGRQPFPQELLRSERDRLVATLRGRLRNRLVRLIARAIAAQLRGGAGPISEGKNHVRSDL